MYSQKRKPTEAVMSFWFLSNSSFRVWRVYCTSQNRTMNRQMMIYHWIPLHLWVPSLDKSTCQTFLCSCIYLAPKISSSSRPAELSCRIHLSKASSHPLSSPAASLPQKMMHPYWTLYDNLNVKTWKNDDCSIPEVMWLILWMYILYVWRLI